MLLSITEINKLRQYYYTCYARNGIRVSSYYKLLMKDTLEEKCEVIL